METHAARDARRLSAAVFGNEKTAEILNGWGTRGAATAQELANELGIAHSMVRSVLLRLAGVGVLRALPRAGGSRGALYYGAVDGPLWRAMLGLAAAVEAEIMSVSS